MNKQLLEAICQLPPRDTPHLVAIEGACGVGKTTVGQQLQQELGCPLVHMDDFFLPFAQRGGVEEFGSNMDKSTLLQLFGQLSLGNETTYRPYRCQQGFYGDSVTVRPEKWVIVEGVYSLLPEFRTFFSLKVFLQEDWAVREQRLLARGGQPLLDRFLAEWIPREEGYFRGCLVQDCCDLVLPSA